MRSLFIGNRAIYKEAYKAGYTRPDVPSNKPEKVLVAPFKGTKDEYFDYLSILVGSNSGCSGEGRNRHYYRFFMAVYEDAKILAETPEQKKRAERFASHAANMLTNEMK